MYEKVLPALCYPVLALVSPFLRDYKISRHCAVTVCPKTCSLNSFDDKC